MNSCKNQAKYNTIIVKGINETEIKHHKTSTRERGHTYCRRILHSKFSDLKTDKIFVSLISNFSINFKGYNLFLKRKEKKKK